MPRAGFRPYHEFVCLFLQRKLELGQSDFGEIGADMVGIAGVNVVPGGFHAGDFGGVGEFREEGTFEGIGDGAREDAGDVHLRVARTSKAKVDHANHVVVIV